MDAEIRLGLIGCGRIAERGYVEAARRAEGVRLLAVADPDEARRGRLASGVPGYPSARAMLASVEVDALVVATPSSTHLADASCAAEAGVPALVEKPPAPTVEDADRLARLDPPPWIGFNRRFEPPLAELRRAVPGDATFTFEFRYRRRSWAPYAADDDVLLDLGTHLVDLLRWLSGAEVQQASARILNGRRAALRLELERGSARMDCASDRPYRERVEVRDRSGRLVGTHLRGGLWRGALARISSQRGAHPLVDSLRLQLEALGRAVAGGDAKPLATAADGLAAMRVLDSARRSAARGESSWPVPLDGG